MRISDWSSDVCSSDLALGGNEALKLQLPFDRSAIAVPFERRLNSACRARRIGERPRIDDIARAGRPAGDGGAVEAGHLHRGHGSGARRKGERGEAEQGGGTMTHHARRSEERTSELQSLM